MIIIVNNGATEQTIQVSVSTAPSIGDVAGLTAALAAKANKSAPVFTNVPTSDPLVAGAVFNNGGVLMISAGP